MASTAHLTIEDFERLPNEIAERHELIDGELVEVSGNVPEHNVIRDFLTELLRGFVRTSHLGFVISEQEYDFGGDARGPDVTFFGHEKMPLLAKKKRVQRFVPDLAVEIVSENDTYNQLLKKKEVYLAHGVSEVWIVAPESREVSVYAKDRRAILGQHEELTSQLLPGFKLTVRELFEQL
jgi:Uma2 family endonuclease